MTLAREAALVALKDLRVEAHSRVVLTQVLPFGAVSLLLFAFALDTDRDVLPIVAPGLFWLTVLLSTLLAVSRSFAIESEHGARDALRLSGLDGSAIFLGKAGAVAAQLLGLEAVLLLGVFVLYDVDVHGVVVLLPVMLLATVALASIGTVYGVLAAGIRVRETLVPLLVLPASTPVLLASSRSFEYSLADDLGPAWRWASLVAMIAVVSTTIGLVAFGPLLEES